MAGAVAEDPDNFGLRQLVDLNRWLEQGT